MQRSQYKEERSSSQVTNYVLPSKAALHVDKPLRLELSVEVDGAPNSKREKPQGEKKDDGFCKRAN